MNNFTSSFTKQLSALTHRTRTHTTRTAHKMSTLPPGPLPTKIRTSFLSLAMCDALGSPVQFMPRGTFPVVTSMVPCHQFALPAGHWTDDTSMALCIGASMLETGRWDVLDQSRRFGDWLRNGYMSSIKYAFDVGSGTNLGVALMIESGFTAEGLEKVRKQNDKPRFSGNGSLMRVLPVALGTFQEGTEKSMEHAKESSLPTHPNKVCQEACAVYTLLVCTILEKARAEDWSLKKKDLLDLLKTYPYETEEIRNVLGPDSHFTSKPDSELSASGYVVDTIQCSLWTFFNTISFEEGALRVVNFGDDADTTAAIYGGIAGAWYADVEIEEAKEGKESSFWTENVQSWYQLLAKRDLVEKVAKGLAGLPKDSGLPGNSESVQ